MGLSSNSSKVRTTKSSCVAQLQNADKQGQNEQGQMYNLVPDCVVWSTGWNEFWQFHFNCQLYVLVWFVNTDRPVLLWIDKLRAEKGDVVGSSPWPDQHSGS